MKAYFVLFFAVFSQIFAVFGQFQVQLSNSEKVENSINYPHYAYYPDGHISVLPDEKSGYIMFWSEFESHRSVGNSQFVEDQTMLEPSNAVFGKRGNFNNWDNGGSWLMSVFRKEGNQFIGFYHAEDHWYPHTDNDIAWKSLAVTYSTDAGKTWAIGKQIITSPSAKPSAPTWGGSGDCCVVWDHINKRWMCYYQENWILMAVSTDPNGAPGTWKKYYNGAFTSDGLGGQHSKLPGLENAAGGNPSVHWNTYLQKWVMVWHGWAPAVIYIASSADGITWDTPQSIISSEIVSGGKTWYPTIIGNTDVEAGQIAKIYYADITNNFSSRVFRSRTITFLDSNNTASAIAQIDQPLNGSTITMNMQEIKAGIKNIKAAISKAEFYVNGALVGTDSSFPYKIKWQPAAKGNYTLKVVFTDKNGTIIETATINTLADSNTRVKEIDDENFLLYPCPASDYIVLDKLPIGKKVIQIYNSNQQLIFETISFDQMKNLNISEFAKGMYILKILTDKSVLSRKIIKQ